MKRPSSVTVPVEVISLSPVRHISLVASEKMVTGLRPSTCLITGSWPTRPNSCTRFIAGEKKNKTKNRHRYLCCSRRDRRGWTSASGENLSNCRRFTHISPGWGWCPCSWISPAAWTSVDKWEREKTVKLRACRDRAVLCLTVLQLSERDRRVRSVQLKQISSALTRHSWKQMKLGNFSHFPF